MLVNKTMKKDFDFLAKTIVDFADNKPLYYIPNKGNFGDGLIRYGTLRFFEFYGIKVKEIPFTTELKKQKLLWPSFRKGKVLFGGGGAWCNFWEGGYKTSQLIQEKMPLLVLPSSYEKTYTLPDTVFFARDKYESLQNMPDAKFCHDMAFFIGDEFFNGVDGEGEGNFFRTDIESAGKIVIPENNLDLSLHGNHLSRVDRLFRRIEPFRVVHTDRLHLAIAGCLLKKEVHLYAGGYFKSRAIYQSTLKPNYENIYFHN